MTTTTRHDSGVRDEAAERLRAEFLRLLTTDSETKDRRRRDYNQAIFNAEEGWAVWSDTDLDMVMEKFDKAVRNTRLAATEGDEPQEERTPTEGEIREYRLDAADPEMARLNREEWMAHRAIATKERTCPNHRIEGVSPFCPDCGATA